MKIGLYSPYLDTFGGGEKYLFTAAKFLSEDHEVSLFWDVTADSVIRHGIKERFAIEIPGVSFVPNIFSPSVSFIKRFQDSKKYDAIILLSDGSIPLVSTRLILHFQSPITWVSPGSMKNRLKMRRVAKVFCNSLFTKSYIDRVYHCNSTVIYPPVDIHHEYEAEKEQVILNVGRFGIQESGSSFKKQDVMVEAFKGLVDEGLKKWRLVLIMNVKGEESEKKVEQMRKENEKYPIEFMINPSFDDVWKQYAKAMIYWHAAGFGEDTVMHPDRAEHFGIATVESMGMGAVPIVIDAGGQKEIVRDGIDGYLWKTLSELKEKTIHVIEDEKTRTSLSQSAKQRVMLYDLERFQKEIGELLV